MNKENKTKHIYREKTDQIVSYLRGSIGGQMKEVNGVNCQVMADNQIFGGDHFVVYTDVEL